jgi:hypothetical protein
MIALNMNEPQLGPRLPGTPPPFQAHPTPPRKTLPTGVIVALVCGLLLAVAAGGVGVYFLAKRQLLLRARRSDPNVPLVQHYASANGLITAHYPSDFAAKKLEQGSVLVSRNLGLGDDEALVFTAIAEPITDDVRELARVLENAFEKGITGKGGTVSAGDPRPAKCETSQATYDGIETISMYSIPPGGTITVWSCVFVAGAHGYKLTYLVPRKRITEEGPLLRRIIAAAELSK